LDKVRPLSVGQASRISGITPAALSILMICLKKTSGMKEMAQPQESFPVAADPSLE